MKKTVDDGSLITATTYIGRLNVCDGLAASLSCAKLIFAGSQRIALKQVTSGSTSYFHPDHLGSTSVLTDSSGVSEQNVAYYPYGDTRSNTGTADVAYKYTGKEQDNSTGLYFYEARYYDPILGRFISPDTIVPSPTDPQTFNRYAYVLNNPVKFVDPTGQSPLQLIRLAAKGIGNFIKGFTRSVAGTATVYGLVKFQTKSEFVASVSAGTAFISGQAASFIFPGLSQQVSQGAGQLTGRALASLFAIGAGSDVAGQVAGNVATIVELNQAQGLPSFDPSTDFARVDINLGSVAFSGAAGTFLPGFGSTITRNIQQSTSFFGLNQRGVIASQIGSIGANVSLTLGEVFFSEIGNSISFPSLSSSLFGTGLLTHSSSSASQLGVSSSSSLFFPSSTPSTINLNVNFSNSFSDGFNPGSLSSIGDPFSSIPSIDSRCPACGNSNPFNSMGNPFGGGGATGGGGPFSF